MKKTFFVVLMAVMVATPCLAEVETEGLFSIDGTIWYMCGVFFYWPSALPVRWECGMSGLAFYQGKIYDCSETHCAARPNPSIESGICSYVDLGVMSFVFDLEYHYDVVLAILQPIGLGVFTDTSLEAPFRDGIGIMYKTNDNWKPPIASVDVWGSSGTDVFTVGGIGAIQHYDGSTWSLMTSGTTEDLDGIWGSSSSDVFAIGSEGTILHYDGYTWSSMASGTTADLNAIWGSTGNDVFAVGFNFDEPQSAVILHYNGSTWSAMPTSGIRTLLNDVWGSSGSDVFAVGIDTILHYDGNTWSAMEYGMMSNWFTGIWGGSGSDVFALSENNDILHYDGNTWSAMEHPTTNTLFGIWGSSGSDVFAVGLGAIQHYDGSTWSLMTSGTTGGVAIWGSSGSDVFAVGGETILHYDGSAWSDMVQNK